MPRAKKNEEIKNDVDTNTVDEEVKNIEEEEIDNDIKVEEIKNDVDTNTVDEEANNIQEMKLKIYNQEYTVSQLIEIKKKPDRKKTYLEKETINRFDELMFNYYRGIKHALLKECCGKVYTVNEVKASLNEKGYKIIDVRMSRSHIRFDKTTVDTIIKYIEDCER